MNAKKSAVVKPPVTLSESEVNEILFPELSNDTFTLGDKTEYSIRVLPWKWELVFRRNAIPILTNEMKPFERAIQVIATQQYIFSNDLAIVSTAGQGESDADAFLTPAVASIMLSQDATIRTAASTGVELSKDDYNVLSAKYRAKVDEYSRPDGDARTYLREIVRRQMDKQQMVQKLGESLMARFEEVAVMAGMSKNEFASLKRDFMPQVRSFMEKAGKTVVTLANSSSQSMASGSENTPSEKSSKLSQTETPSADRGEELREHEESMGAVEQPTSA